jgi:hypothetical protein
MKFALIIPSWDKDQAQKTAENLIKHDNIKAINQVVVSGANRTEHRWGTVESMNEGAQKVVNSDVLVFTHDDMEVYENWTEYLEILFTSRPDIGLIGLHGAKGLGSEDIYRTRYRLSQLARFDPLSNLIDAEMHGKRSTVPCEVATVDGFFMAVRKTAYDQVGRWKACLEDNIPYHMYDHWMAMSLREEDYKTYLAPVSCKHYGGGTEVRKSELYDTWAQENGFDGVSDVHTKGHEAFYQRFRGQLPIRVH